MDELCFVADMMAHMSIHQRDKDGDIVMCDASTQTDCIILGQHDKDLTTPTSPMGWDEYWYFVHMVSNKQTVSEKRPITRSLSKELSCRV